MKMKEEWPPNIEEIKAVFNLKGVKPVFTYGDTIYNPYKQVVEPHLEAHEEVHMKQQGDDPMEWWDKYLKDTDFRLGQELEAYGAQYAYAKKELPTKMHKFFLSMLARDLSGEMYGSLLTFGEAESKIRNEAK